MLEMYRQVWAVDFEFMASPGEIPDPVCLVARELKSGKTIRLWRDQFGRVPHIQPTQIACLWLITRRPNWVAIWHLAGECRPEFLTCLPSSVVRLTAFQLSPAKA